MKTIERDELKGMMDAQGDLTVVEVLGEDAYKEYHLPGAINVPIYESFDDAVQEAIPDKDRPVVLYCQDTACQASPDAAKRMEALGYTDVYDYPAGKEHWQEAGLTVQAGAAAG